MALARDMQTAYEQALRDELRASIEVLRCYKQNLRDSTERGLLIDAVAVTASWAAELATIRSLLHLRRVARHYAGQVAP